MSVNSRNGPNQMTGVLIRKKKKRERERFRDSHIRGARYDHRGRHRVDASGFTTSTRSQEEARCGPALGL